VIRSFIAGRARHTPKAGYCARVKPNASIGPSCQRLGCGTVRIICNLHRLTPLSTKHFWKQRLKVITGRNHNGVCLPALLRGVEQRVLDLRHCRIKVKFNSISLSKKLRERADNLPRSTGSSLGLQSAPRRPSRRIALAHSRTSLGDSQHGEDISRAGQRLLHSVGTMLFGQNGRPAAFNYFRAEKRKDVIETVAMVPHRLRNYGDGDYGDGMKKKIGVCTSRVRLY
jgi:hypothetical protein